MGDDGYHRILIPHTRPAQRRRRGPRAAGGAARMRLPRAPAPVTLAGSRRTTGGGAKGGGEPVIGWPHLLVNGSDGEFRRMLRGLAALVRRLEAVHDYAAEGVGLTGIDLEVLLAIAEGPGAEGGVNGGADAGMDGSAGEGMAMTALARRLDASPYYVSGRTARLARRGLIEKRPEPGHRRRKRLVLTEAGRAAVGRAAPLIAGSHNVAFAGLGARDFAALRRIAATLDDASTRAAEIVARHVGADPPQALRELRRAMKSLGGK